MSTALAIAGVTAVIQNLLNIIYNHPSSALGAVAVSALAPDIVQNNLGGGPGTQLQANVFLHQVTPNAAWRNVGVPSVGADGSTRLQNPPVALDLHYLLTVYGSQDCQAEALLGHAILMLFENPVLTRSQIRDALANLPATNPLAGALGASGLADQIEMIKITPATLGREEVAWLWTALKADYRPTFPFQVSVVLMHSQFPAVSALPVLDRGVSAQSGLLSPFPTITRVDPPKDQPAACLGDTVTVVGRNLSGTTAIVVSNARLGIVQTVASLSNVGNGSVQFNVPNPNLPPPQPNPTDLPVGLYLLRAQTGGAPAISSSNGLPLAIAPKITRSPPGPLVAGTQVPVAIACTPYLRPSQQVSLLIGSQEALADPFTTPTNSPSFTFPTLEPTGPSVPVRLRVDGIDSPIVDMSKSPPVFSGPFIQVN